MIVPADGIAGPVTMAALEGKPHAPMDHRVAALAPGAAHRASPHIGGVAGPVASMSLSHDGAAFMCKLEGMGHATAHLHHPSSGSGVTIGPGFDMKDRTRDEVALELSLAGVSSDLSREAAMGAGLTGSAADRFVKDNRSLRNIGDDVQEALFTRVVGHYVARVRSDILVPLHQYEFDALVSFAYNPGAGWHPVVNAINKHDYVAAMQALDKQVYSHGEWMKGLANRRLAESQLFLFGIYA